MTKYLAGVLSVIAVGVLLIAYGLLAPRGVVPTGSEFGAGARPILAGQTMAVGDGSYYGPVPYGYVPARPGYVYPSGAYGAPTGPYAVPVGYGTQPAVMGVPQPVRTASVVDAAPAPRRVATRQADVSRGRDWKKTALIIGGSSAVGAGVGGLVGGKKGALIGAAIGGGASTIYETTKK